MKSLKFKGFKVEPSISPDDAACFERGCSTCYQCGQQRNSILLNGATYVCHGCGTVSQIPIRHTPAGSLKESRRLAKEKRVELNLQSARRNAIQRIKEKRMAIKFLLAGTAICSPTFIFNLGDFAWPVFCTGTVFFFVGLLSLAYLRSIQV